MNLSEQAQKLLLLIPEYGSIGNVTLRKKFSADFAVGSDFNSVFQAAKSELLSAGVISLGRGKGGSVKRTVQWVANPELNPESVQTELVSDTHTLEVAETESAAEEF